MWAEAVLWIERDEVELWTCAGCGTVVSRNCTGQIRDNERGNHHGKGGDACLAVLSGRIQELHSTIARLRAEAPKP